MDSEEYYAWERVHHFAKKSESDSRCPFDIIGMVEILWIAEFLPSFLCANLRATCVRMRKIIPPPEKMGANMLLRAGVKRGSRDLCKYACMKGAIAFELMLEDAAYFGRLYLCKLAMSWHKDFCEKIGVKQNSLSLIERMAFGAAKGAQSEVFNCAMGNIIKNKASIQPSFWSLCLKNACLGGNIQWCYKMREMLNVHCDGKYYDAILLDGAHNDPRVCMFVFETIGAGLEPYSFNHSFFKLVESGNIEMCKYWVAIAEKLSFSIRFNEAARAACKSGKYEMMNLISGGKDILFSFKTIGCFASVGWFDLCYRQISKMNRDGIEIDWKAIAAGAVKYRGGSDFCGFALCNALKVRSEARRDSIIEMLVLRSLKSQHAPRIRYLISLHRNQSALMFFVLERMTTLEHLGQILPFLGNIFPNFTSEDLTRRLEILHVPFADGWLKAAQCVTKMAPIFNYCKKLGICPSFCERFSKMRLHFGKPAEYSCEPSNIPLV